MADILGSYFDTHQQKCNKIPDSKFTPISIEALKLNEKSDTVNEYFNDFQLNQSNITQFQQQKCVDGRKVDTTRYHSAWDNQYDIIKEVEKLSATLGQKDVRILLSSKEGLKTLSQIIHILGRGNGVLDINNTTKEDITKMIVDTLDIPIRKHLPLLHSKNGNGHISYSRLYEKDGKLFQTFFTIGPNSVIKGKTKEIVLKNNNNNLK